MTNLDIDAPQWPDIATYRRAPVRGAVAAALLRRLASRLSFRVELPDGRSFGRQDNVPRLQLHRPEAFYHRVGVGGLIGFGESYQAGDWDSDDLPGLLTVLASNIDTLVPRSLQWLRSGYVASKPRGQDNTVDNAARNVSRHYDLSNALFALFLDETMTYSAALFGQLPRTWENLAAAQRDKMDRLLDFTGVGAGVRVLEIGTGWGELAVRAAQRGATVHSVTLSQAQREYAISHAQREGVSDRVHIDLCDYRDIDPVAKYDVILSVEMIEAVGERHCSSYFATLDKLLMPDGRIGLQAITMPHARMMASRHTYTWIHKYIFPGGLIPSKRVIRDQAAAHHLSIVDSHQFGEDYAHTLRLWRERFCARTAALEDLGFDDTFRRTWQLYLAYSEAGFASHYLDVTQFILGSQR